MAEGPMSTPRRPAPRSMGTPTMPISRGALASWGLFACVIVVEPAPGFAAKVAGCDHLAQQCWRGKARFFELVEQPAGDNHRRFHPTQVNQRNWPTHPA